MLDTQAISCHSAVMTNQYTEAAMQMTYAIAMAAARDAGNRSMREAGRMKWSRKDYSVASATFNKLYGKQMKAAA